MGVSVFAHLHTQNFTNILKINILWHYVIF